MEMRPMKDRDILAAWGLGIVYGAFVAVAVVRCSDLLYGFYEEL